MPIVQRTVPEPISDRAMGPAVPCRLVIESEANRGLAFPLRESSISIGRGPQNSIQIIDKRMSRAHAVIKREPDGWVLRDLQSKNRTVINGRSLREAVKLVPGDQIHMGSTEFVFETDLGEPEGEGVEEAGVRLVDSLEMDAEASRIMELPVLDDRGILLESVRSVPESDEERLRTIYQVGALMQSILGLDELLNKVLDIVCQVLQPDQACIMLYDRQDKNLVPKAVRRSQVQQLDIVISSSVVHQAINDRVAVLMSDGPRDKRFNLAESIVLQNIHSAICVPLVAKNEVLGALYLDLRATGHAYKDRDLQWAAGVASQAALAIAMSLLHAEILSRTEREREIQIARSIQMNLLPKSMPQIPGFEFAGLSRPARSVGGDYYDIIELDEGGLLLTIADVSGKGVPSALLLASYRAGVRVESRQLHRDGLIRVVERLNRSICQDTMSNMFITTVISYFDPATRKLTYCNAGHLYPLLRLPDGRVVELDTGGSFLGIMPQMQFEEASVDLPAGSMVIFITDGVSDAQNPEGDLFGNERLTEFIERNHAKSAREICDLLEQTVAEFQGDAEQFDDLTVLVLKAGEGRRERPVIDQSKIATQSRARFPE